MSIFLDASESTEIYAIKKMLTPIIGRLPDDQELYYLKESVPTENVDMINECDMAIDSAIQLQNDKRLIDYFISTSHAKPQSPALIGLALKNDDGFYERLEITPYSSPPPLPDIMNPVERVGASENHVNDRKM